MARVDALGSGNKGWLLPQISSFGWFGLGTGMCLHFKIKEIPWLIILGWPFNQ